MKNIEKPISNVVLVIYSVIFIVSMTILLAIHGTKYVDTVTTIIVALLSIVGTKIALVLFTYLVEKEWYYDR